jgi:predicted transcriptional regulator
MTKQKLANSELISSITVVLSDTTSTPQEIATRVLETIQGNSKAFYSKPNELALFSAPARVLIVLAEQPDITQRALSIYLGISEAAVQKSVKILIDNGLVAKTKVKGRNVYKINEKMLLEHSDIAHVLNAVKCAKKAVAQAEEAENSPF